MDLNDVYRIAGAAEAGQINYRTVVPQKAAYEKIGTFGAGGPISPFNFIPAAGVRYATVGDAAGAVGTVAGGGVAAVSEVVTAGVSAAKTGYDVMKSIPDGGLWGLAFLGGLALILVLLFKK